MSDNTTKEKILDTAEKLFVENGLSATSLRAIIKEAGVNTAAVHYHFGSKQGLIEAVFGRRAGQLNAARLRLLDEVESENRSGPLPLEDVVRAFVRPVISCDMDHSSPIYMIPQLMGRAITEPAPFYRQIVQRAFKETFERFTVAVNRALPELDAEEVMWRIHFMVGAMIFTVMVPKMNPERFPEPTATGDPDVVTERLVQFVAAGMRTPAPQAAGKETN